MPEDKAATPFNHASTGVTEAEGYLRALGIDFDRTPDGRLVAHGDIDISGRQLTVLPDLSGVIVEGNFSCQDNQLTSLKGAPSEVRETFRCDGNQLTNLEGAPRRVGGKFLCDGNKLTSLAGSPQVVGSWFFCDDNLLTSLEGAPQEVGMHFYCRNNRLTTLEGGPRYIQGSFFCQNNRLEELEGAPVRADRFYCKGNRLRGLSFAPHFFKRLDSDFGIFASRAEIPEHLKVKPARSAPAKAPVAIRLNFKI